MPSLYVLQGPDKDKTFRTASPRTVLGRLSDQVPFTDHSISREHAELRRENGSWVIEDNNSSNGTYINGDRIHQPTALQSGDQIRMGSTLIVFTGDDSASKHPPAARSQDLVELDSENERLDSSILASATASEDSVILASPETYDAVHAWNVMYQLAETIGTFGSVGEFLERMTDIIFKHLQVDRIFILMRQVDTDELTPFVVRYRTERKHRSGKIVTSRRIIHHVLETKEGILCANAQSDTRFGAEQKDASIHRLGLRSVICVPILSHDDVAGVIHLDCNMAHHTYTQQQLLLAAAIGKMAGMAIENARLIQSRVEHERLAAVGETVAHLSHHIRNILQGMRSGADVIEMALERSSLDAVRAGWQIVQRNLERTYRLATNMLTFSKERQPQVALAQLNTVIADVIHLAERQALDKGITLETDCGELPPVPLDVDGIHQVATNMVINAIDACPAAGGGRIVVRTRYDADRAEAVITIADNGPGIAEDERGKIFDTFHSTKGHGGTGLGLAAAKKIIDELNGMIEVDSSSAGTTFTVRLAATHEGIADSDETHGPAA